jgi:hypothetical protein
LGFFEYATSWNSFLRVDAAGFGAALERWLEHYRREGIERIGGGVVVLRRRAGGDNWLLPLETPNPRPGADAHLRRLFAAQDFLRDRDDAALLDEQLVPVADHVVEIALRPGSMQSRHISLPAGLGFRAELDEPMAELLSRLEPGRSLRDAGGVAAPKLARRLLELGFVEPSS